MEFRVAENWRVRAGSIYQQSPFVNGSAVNSSIITYTGGLGYRKDRFFIDLAGMFRKDQESYWLYDPALVDETQISNTTIFGIVSVGIRY
jgi:long-subunit fatty acid transport protein